MPKTLTPNNNILQQLNAGFNSLNQQQQQQQQQQLASGAAANQFLGANQYAGLQHQYGAAQSYAGGGQFGAPSAFNAPQIAPATTEPTVRQTSRNMVFEVHIENFAFACFRSS